MIVCIPDILTAEELRKLREEAAKIPFVPGSTTAGKRAKGVKNNEEISQKSEERKLDALAPDAPETDLAHQTYDNLLRMWSDP